jgi:hypothetical protein
MSCRSLLQDVINLRDAVWDARSATLVCLWCQG